MTSTDVSSQATRQTSDPALGVDMNLEVVTIPVTDFERAKAFYQRLGWRMDADRSGPDGSRLLQFTPPHSGCSIHFGSGLTAAAPGSADRMMLTVKDIDVARQDLLSRGVEVSEVSEPPIPPELKTEGRSYFAYASFRDPDGNGWLLKEVTTRIPGREWND
jgi:catechol 2,3-dioxygenase-like lactoylglutathione lyase family enzyme